MHLPFLSILIWLPVLGSIPILMLHRPHQVQLARSLALLISAALLLLSLAMIGQFNADTAAMQFRETFSWVPSMQLNYDVGVDGISLPLIILTCFTTFVIVLASWSMVQEKVAQYLAAFLVMQGMVIGVFAALDAILFYFFWEGMLIPMYLSIGIWGGPNRAYAAIKFFIYTFFGSALLLVVLLYLGLQANSFNILDFYHLRLPYTIQLFVFFGFLLAFAIKVPMWPLHTWLPDAHTEAPTGGSVVLAALMLKIGGYGFLRFSLPIVPAANHTFAWMMIILSLIAIVYVGFIAIAQTDMKKLIAYSSVAHMGFVTLGCYLALLIAMNNIQDAILAIDGAMVQMISHAFGSGAMFLAFGVLYHQLATRDIKSFGGIAKVMPVFSAFFILFAMSNVGLPGTSGFVGEFLVIISAFKTSFWVTCIAASTLIVGAVYTLWMVKRVFFGKIVYSAVAQLHEASALEIGIFVLLAIPVLWIGVYPNPLLHLMEASLQNVLSLAMRV
ncbi:MAG: NADH-quinone oxidoreductase subunit M [Gammaproteobacteria bacterium RIFCSPHIGHO2_12_FULL_42_13]|nr:MAG: NADH-quinone oxidoreductase subunit M [Gammaproteobacteria bacterium RIFCSPHIGHO2_12_FULL_42_13]